MYRGVPGPWGIFVAGLCGFFLEKSTPFIDQLNCRISALTITGTIGSIMGGVALRNIKELREAFGDAVASVVRISS